MFHNVCVAVNRENNLYVVVAVFGISCKVLILDNFELNGNVLFFSIFYVLLDSVMYFALVGYM